MLCGPWLRSLPHFGDRGTSANVSLISKTPWNSLAFIALSLWLNNGSRLRSHITLGNELPVDMSIIGRSSTYQALAIYLFGAIDPFIRFLFLPWGVHFVSLCVPDQGKVYSLYGLLFSGMFLLPYTDFIILFQSLVILICNFIIVDLLLISQQQLWAELLDQIMIYFIKNIPVSIWCFLFHSLVIKCKL